MDHIDLESLILFSQLSEKPKNFLSLANSEHRKIRIKIAQRKDITAAALKVLASDADISVRRLVARHRNSTPEILAHLAKGEDIGVKTGVIQNQATPTEILSQLSQNKNLEIDRALASKRNTPESILLALINHEEENIRINVARNSNLRVNNLWSLSEDPSKTVRSFVFNRLVKYGDTLKALRHFCADNDASIRANVAKHADIPPDLIEHLSQDSDNWVRRNIAARPDLGDHFIEFLSRDKDLHVRAAIAERVNDDVKILVRLSKDNEEHVRCVVAKNSATPVKILKKLSKDKSSWVLEALARNRALSIEQFKKLLRKHLNDRTIKRELENRNFNVQRIFAQDPLTSQEEFHNLLESKFEKIHCYLAENPSVGDAVLRKLATRGSRNCKIKLLNRPVQSEEVFDLVMADKNIKREILISEDSADVLAKYYSLDQDIELLRALAFNPSTDTAFLHELAQHDDAAVRVNVARNTSASAIILTLLAKDRQEGIRKYVALHKKLSQDVINILQEDRSSQVKLNLLRRNRVSEDILRNYSLNEDNNFRKRMISTILNRTV